MYKLQIFSFLFTLCLNGMAQASSWQIGMKGGVFQPNLNQWETFYDGKLAGSGIVEASYSPFSLIEIGLRTSFIRDSGVGSYIGNGDLGGEVGFNLFNGEAFVQLVGRFAKRQWLVPYAGVGYGRDFYLVTVKYQDSIKGGMNALSYVGGLRVLVDGLDKRAAKILKEDFGVQHSFWIFEYGLSSASIAGTDLGGATITSGIFLEF